MCNKKAMITIEITDDKIKFVKETKEMLDSVKELTNQKEVNAQINISSDKYACGLPQKHGEYVIDIGFEHLCHLKSNCFFVAELLNRPELTDSLYKYALLSSIYHEIGHVKYDQNCEGVLDQELAADDYEFQEITKLASNEAFLGSLVSMITLLQLDIMIGRNPSKVYSNHPATLERIDTFLSHVTSPIEDFKSAFVFLMTTILKLRPALLQIIKNKDYTNISKLLESGNQFQCVCNSMDEHDDDEND